MSIKLQRSFTLLKNVIPVIRKLLYDFKTKWQQVKRTEKIFLNKFHEWLNVFVSFEQIEIVPKKTQTNLGRPSLEFLDSSERTKRRKTKDIRSQTSVEELSYAAQMSLRAVGKLDAAQTLLKI